MKRRFKFVALILCIVILSTLLFALAACNKEKEKKAIIYVTALFAGGYYNEETGAAVWDPINADLDIDSIMKGTAEIEDVVSAVLSENNPGDILDMLKWEKGGLLYDMSLDQDGNPLSPEVVPANGLPQDGDGNIMDISYGVFGLYKPVIDSLKERYGSGVDVIVYNQDWRLSPSVTAEALEKFINDNKYTDVVLLSHSMGGAVVNSYLARSEANRNKVRLNLSFAPATLGSFDALAALSCPVEYLDKIIGSGEGTEQIKGLIKNYLNTVGEFLTNNIGLISLVPSWQLIHSAQYEDGEYGITLDGKPITTKDELYSFYRTQPWAYYMVDAEDNGVQIKTKIEAQIGQTADPYGMRIKSCVGSLGEYFDSLFVDGSLASEKVNTYYFVGTEKNTIVGLDCTTMRNEKGEAMFDSDGNVRYTYKLRYARKGDGTVPFYSSVGGSAAKIDALERSGRLIRYENKGHFDVGADWNIMRDDTFRLIDEVFAPVGA